MKIGSKLCRAAGWILLAALVYAPWALGCRKPWGVEGLAVFAFLSVTIWLGGLIVWGRRPAVPWWGLLCVGGLLALGWWMVVNANGQVIAALPGAVDETVCAAMMLQITAVLAALVVACDLAREQVWRRRLIATMGVTGISIASWGLLQKMGLLPAIAHREFAASVFATFDYHGNAGAFLNLAIPAVFVMALSRHRQIAAAGLLVCVAGAMVNVSRAAAAICVIMVFVLVGWKQREVYVAQEKRCWLAPALMVTFVAVTLAAGGAAWQRWNQIASMETDNNPRLIMLKIAAPMAVEAGFFGEGAGSFKVIYPTSPHLIKALYKRWKVVPYHAGEEVSIYSYVHNDYLQYVIEWGWVGAALWAGLIGAAVARGVSAYRKGKDRIVVAASLVALGAVFTHALVDWPLQVASLQLYTAMYVALLMSSLTCASC